MSSYVNAEPLLDSDIRIVPTSPVSRSPVDDVSHIMPLSSPRPQTKPPVTQSVNELRSLSTALHTFILRYDELQNHLDSVRESINLLSEELRGSPDQETTTSAHNEADDEIPTAIAAESPAPPDSPNPNSALGDEVTKGLPVLETSALGGEVTKGLSGLETSALGDEVTNGVSGKPELETLCKKMCGKGVRRYMALSLDNLDKLREEVPKALSLAPKPAKLVLEAVGKFFLQGSKAFAKNSPMVSGRQAAILVSECYLLSDCGKEMDDEVKTEAESSAVAWRKRLILEGGIPKASELDARGLLLFIGSFGIPSLFRRDDVISLILLSDPREISDALKRSCHLYPKISDWIPNMIKCGMRVEAAYISYVFGLTEKFQPHAILTMHLKESKDSCDRKKREAKAFPQRAKEATEKHLATMKSIVACLEYHEVDPSKLLPDWQIKGMIVKAEKDIAGYCKKIEAKASQKRKVEGIESHQKRQRYTAETSLRPGQLTGLHDGRSAVPHVDQYDSYDMRSRFVGQYSGHRGEILVDKYGQIINPSGQAYGWNVANGAYDDRLATAQAIAGKYVGDGKYSLFGSSSSVEGFAGPQTIPSTAATARRSIPDLYQFADSVEGQSHYSGTSQHASASAAPLLLPDQHTSYYYQ